MVNKDDRWFMDWYWSEATEEQKRLHDRYMLFDETLFGDMVFAEGSASRKLIEIKSKAVNSDSWLDDVMTLPDELEYYNSNWFKTQISDLEEHAMGQFDPVNQIITISPKAVDSDSVLLHEMIHAHEFVVNEMPMYFHDMILWALYTDLKCKIDGLDDAISQHAHFLNEWDIARFGGCHDILFLLKSFDLDIRQGYTLGTVFGYSGIDDFKYLK